MGRCSGEPDWHTLDMQWHLKLLGLPRLPSGNGNKPLGKTDEHVVLKWFFSTCFAPTVKINNTLVLRRLFGHCIPLVTDSLKGRIAGAQTQSDLWDKHGWYTSYWSREPSLRVGVVQMYISGEVKAWGLTPEVTGGGTEVQLSLQLTDWYRKMLIFQARTGQSNRNIL